MVRKWIARKVQGIRDLLLPFSSIAQELRILRELYELDLANRNPPTIRITEAPKKGDTEVLWDELTEEQTKLKELQDSWDDSV